MLTAVTGLVTRHRGDAGAPDEAKGSKSGGWKGREAWRTETGLARFEQEAFGGGF